MGSDDEYGDYGVRNPGWVSVPGKQGSHSWMHRDLGNKPKVCVMCGTTDPWEPCIIDREVPANPEPETDT